MGSKQTRHHRAGPLDVEILRSAVLLSGHRTRHETGGLDALTALDAGVITSGRFPQARMPTDVIDRFLKSQGAGVDPVYAALLVADLPAHAATHAPTGADEVNDIDIGNTGVLLSAHQARHRPAGLDPLPVGVPSSIGSANAEGVAEAYARQDHVHNRVYPVNRLAGVIGTFDTFDTNPSNPERMTDGDWETGTGEGVKTLAAAGTFGNIYFDMGASYPVLLIGNINCHRDSGAGTISVQMSKSTDGVNYVECGLASISGQSLDRYYIMQPMFMYGRWLCLRFYAAGTTDPSVYHAAITEVMALQFLP